jgi:hypothetical protein
MRSGLILAALLAAPAWGADGADEDLRAKTQNPVGSLISVPFENNVDFGAPNGTAYVLNFQPVVPVTVGNWNLINRPILPIAYVPGFIGGVPGLPSGSEGDGGGRLFNIGKQPINIRGGVFGDVVRPDFAPKWALKFTVQLLFPK